MISARAGRAIATIAACIASFFYAQASADTAINLKGNLVIPDCVVNGNAPLTVNFGDIDLQFLEVSRTVYVPTEFNIPLECPYTNGIPALTVVAVPATGSQAREGAIKTSKDSEGLVVYLREGGGGASVPLNSASGIDISSSVSGSGTSRTLTLNAGLGQLNGTDKLTAGAFTSTANLLVRYE